MGLPIVSELVSVILSNPIFAWFLLLFVLGTDTFLSGLLFPDGAGVIGYIVTTVIQSMGIPFVITSFMILIISAFTPLIGYAIKRSAKH